MRRATQRFGVIVAIGIVTLAACAFFLYEMAYISAD